MHQYSMLYDHARLSKPTFATLLNLINNKVNESQDRASKEEPQVATDLANQARIVAHQVLGLCYDDNVSEVEEDGHSRAFLQLG